MKTLGVSRGFLLLWEHDDCPTFVNADLIAAGLSPFNPETAAMRAGRLMVQMIAEHVARGDSFAFETTLADKSYARHIPEWQASGYHVSLVFWRSPLPRQPSSAS